MTLTSQVIITSQIENTILELEKLRRSEHIVEIISPAISLKLIDRREEEMSDPHIQRIVTEKEIFSVSDAKVVIEKAYMASEAQTVLMLVATAFSTIVQNKLLKVIEEPPKNKIFLLITESKSTILPTIKSRLPIVVLSKVKDEVALDLDMKQLSLATVYDFTQKHKRTDGKSMKRMVERISREAIASQSYDLDEASLSLFSNAFLALDVGSPPQFVLNTLLLKLLARKKR
jgi:DNA polymerase-3 subunit delta'